MKYRKTKKMAFGGHNKILASSRVSVVTNPNIYIDINIKRIGVNIIYFVSFFLFFFDTYITKNIINAINIVKPIIAKTPNKITKSKISIIIHSLRFLSALSKT